MMGHIEEVRQLVWKATLLIGSERHLSYFPNHPAQRLVLGDLTLAIKEIRQLSVADGCIVVLVTGDPLFWVRSTAVDRTSSGAPDVSSSSERGWALSIALSFPGKMRE